MLRYDLIGRGYSDRPEARYNNDLFCNQMRELLDILSINKVNKIGVPIGAPVIETLSIRNRDRIHNPN